MFSPQPLVSHKLRCFQPPSLLRVLLPCTWCVAAAGELRALLDRLQYRRGTDLLLSVGDLVNKGPDSEKVGSGKREMWGLGKAQGLGNTSSHVCV